MLREIHIDAFSKIITSYKPELFSTLTVLESRPYSPSVECYSGTSLPTQSSTSTRTATSST